MPEYTALTVLALILVVLTELFLARTGIFRSGRYWVSLAIVLGFQVLVDGRLTALPDPIVSYDPRQIMGVRFPFDIPIEDFGFGAAMTTAAVLVWLRTGGRRLDERSEHRLRSRSTSL